MRTALARSRKGTATSTQRTFSKVGVGSRLAVKGSGRRARPPRKLHHTRVTVVIRSERIMAADGRHRIKAGRGAFRRLAISANP